MQGRRSFLLSAGTLVTVSTIGTVSAKSQNEARNKEITEAVFSGIADDGAEGARHALKDLGLDPTIEKVGLENRGEAEDEQQMAPQYVYEKPGKSDSHLYVATGATSSDETEVWTSVTMHLKDPTYTARNSWWCPDAIAIGYNSSDWAAVGEPSITATRDHTAKFTADDVAEDALAGTVELKDHSDKQYGSDADDRLPDAIATMTGTFRLREGKVPTTLWGSYTHTYSYTPGGVIESISGGKGGVSVTLNTRASPAWSRAHPSDPEEEISQ